MDGAKVFRLISLIPDRVARTQSGSLFDAAGRAERIELLVKFLHWLGPLEPISKETQQALGVRSGGGRPLDAEGETAEDSVSFSEAGDEELAVEEPEALAEIVDDAPAAPQEPRQNAWAA